MKYKAGILIGLAGMLLTASSAMAASEMYSLTDSKGRAVYEEKLLDETSRSGNTLEDQLRSLKSAKLAKQLLKKGEAALFYIAEGNPDRKTNIERSSLSFTASSKLREQLKGQHVKILDTVKKYKFENASLTYDPLTLSDEELVNLTDQLERQAGESGKGYAMHPLQLSGNHWNLFSTYKHGSSQLLVQAIKSDEKTVILRSPSQDDGVKKEKLKVNGAELLYTEYKSEPGKEKSREISKGKGITFVYSIPDSKFHIQYHIEDIGGNLSKQDLIDVAKAYLK